LVHAGRGPGPWERDVIRLILNILWFILGGWLSGLLWLLGGLVLAITIVGLPYTGAAWRIAGFAFWPFGKEIVSREIVTGKSDIGTGPLGFVLNIVWFLLGGWYIALSHLVAAFFEAITIIGIPFAIKDLQLAGIALAPIGKTVVVKN
jgi:uncharacterized membrane protein YccF (DUF307 family)